MLQSLPEPAGFFPAGRGPSQASQRLADIEFSNVHLGQAQEAGAAAGAGAPALPLAAPGVVPRPAAPAPRAGGQTAPQACASSKRCSMHTRWPHLPQVKELIAVRTVLHCGAPHRGFFARPLQVASWRAKAASGLSPGSVGMR